MGWLVPEGLLISPLAAVRVSNHRRPPAGQRFLSPETFHSLLKEDHPSLNSFFLILSGVLADVAHPITNEAPAKGRDNF